MQKSLKIGASFKTILSAFARAVCKLYKGKLDFNDKAETNIFDQIKNSDLYEKSEKAIYTKGACFLNVLAPCPRGWGYSTDELMKINKLAVETCYWPLYEVENGKYKCRFLYTCIY